MINTTMEQELHEYLDRMPAEMQKEVINFARTLVDSQADGRSTAARLDDFSGAIGADDLSKMAQAIEENCERVNPDDWR